MKIDKNIVICPNWEKCKASCNQKTPHELQDWCYIPCSFIEKTPPCSHKAYIGFLLKTKKITKEEAFLYFL